MLKRVLYRTLFAVTFLSLFPAHFFHKDIANPFIPLALAADKLSVVQVTPSGQEVPSGNQVLLRFNQDVVPLGNMQRTVEQIPITIKPALPCQWQWLNTRTLACQLDANESFKPATQYTVIIAAKPFNDKGVSLNKAVTHTFSTQRPAVKRMSFESISQPGLPHTRVFMNQTVSKRALLKALKYQYTVNGEIKQAAAHAYAFEPYRWQAESSKKSEEPIKRASKSQYWVVYPKRPLPKQTEVEIVVLPGLSSTQGALKSQELKVYDAFETFSDFAFTGISCVKEKERNQHFSLQEINSVSCNPSHGISLDFSSPVSESELHGLFELEVNGKKSTLLESLWVESQSKANVYRYHHKDQHYSVWLPVEFPPNSHLRISMRDNAEDTQSLSDVFERPLDNAVDIAFRTQHFSPDYVLRYHNVVLEQHVNSDIPVGVVNVDSLSLDYATDAHGHKKKVIEPGFAKDQRAITPLGVRSLIGQTKGHKSGVLSGSLSSNPPSRDNHHGYKSRIFAQITPYQVHVKLGHFSSLVWVTDMASGELVSDAKVELIKADNDIATAGVSILATATSDEQGLVALDGMETIDPKKKLTGWCRRDKPCSRLFVRVSKGEYGALVPITNDYELQVGGLSDYQVYHYPRQQYGHIKTWGTTAQGIYRRGDEVQFKLYVRNQDNQGLTVAPKGKYTLEVHDASNKVVHTVNEVTLNEHGSMSGAFQLADNALMGWYRFILRSDFSDRQWNAMSVLVTDFTPSPFKLSQQLNGELFAPDDNLLVSVDAALHSGGPYTGADALIEATISTTAFVSTHPKAKKFSFSGVTQYTSQSLFGRQKPLSRKGQVEARFTLPAFDNALLSSTINVQTLVKDDRGKATVSRSSARYLGVDRLVGLNSPEWVYESGKPATLHYLVVDRKGVPVAGTPVTISIEKREMNVAKVKSAGNAYLPNYQEKWVAVADCQGNSQEEQLACSFTPSSAGVYRLTANIKDTQNRTHSSSMQIWVTGEGYVNWQQPNTNALVMVPEKTDYKIGDRARYLVKNPYPGAQALITIERYGILKTWQQTLEGSTPVIEFDIEPEYLPGAYLSVLVTVPRVAHDIPDFGQVDLAKPTYKMGYQRFTVTDPYKTIDFAINTDAETYKPGEVVSLTIQPKLSNVDGVQDLELAVSVLDESVLDLVAGGESYFDPSKGFDQLEQLDVGNYNLLTRLLGLQKFSKKGANPGGGGGALEVRDDIKGVAYFKDSIRTKVAQFSSSDAELEESVVTGVRASAPAEADASGLDEVADVEPRDSLIDLAHWEDKVHVNDDGSVTIQFKLPDNLTAWRVLVIGTTPTDRMGLGQHSFKVNKLTEIRPVLPNQVLEGDQFNAGFSVHNRSDEARTLTVSIDAKGDAQTLERFTTDIALAAHERETVFMPMIINKLGSGIQQGDIEYTVRAYDAVDGDALRHTLPVNKHRNMTSAALYGSTNAATISQALQIPDDAAGDLGAITVRLSPSIINNIDGAFKYMRDYPYTCWEQRLTKAVMASHYQRLSPYLDTEATSWADSQLLPQRILDNAASFQSDNGGMAYFSPRDAYVSPYLSAYTALAFTWLKDSDYTIPATVQNKLSVYLKSLLRKNSFPQGYSKSSIATIRAVALSALANSGELTLSELRRYLPQSTQMSLFGKAQLLSALSHFDNTQEERTRLRQEILAYSNSSSGKITFNEVEGAQSAWMLSSSMRSHCAILDTFVSAPQLLIDDELPSKLAQSIVAERGGRQHWENTQENVFCMTALARYAAVYEADSPELDVAVLLDQQAIGHAAFKSVKDKPQRIVQPMQSNFVGQAKTVAIEHQGKGRVYYQTLLQYSPTTPQANRVNSGLEVRRELSVLRDKKWHLLASQDTVRRGETVKVDLFVSAPADRHFIAVRDPLAGGLEPVNTQLANAGNTLSVQQANKAAKGSYWYQHDDWQRMSFSPWGFYHQELGHDAVTFYADFLSQGRYHLSYTAQAIATGDFTQLPVLAEEMYNADVYGKGVERQLRIIE